MYCILEGRGFGWGSYVQWLFKHDLYSSLQHVLIGSRREMKQQVCLIHLRMQEDHPEQATFRIFVGKLHGMARVN
ncbi:hypothetical protein RIF29_14547 [Crotalaria pallida]|uniref:Uncharacterized protein n=1 Tax=Crotalaria pallida TaxID=3830 RepID=A0AAN9FFI9_CROPI